MPRAVVILLVFILSSSKLLADNIPVIVISPGKSIQSYNTVDSSVSVIDGNTIEGSQDSFLADVLNNNTTSMNYFQMGGQGTNTGIQIRGFEKRYATIYIDGIKMNDPSTTDNSFYANFMKFEKITVFLRLFFMVLCHLGPLSLHPCGSELGSI